MTAAAPIPHRCPLLFSFAAIALLLSLCDPAKAQGSLSPQVIDNSRATSIPENYLNIPLLSLPPRYLADIPLEKRTVLLTLLSELPWDRRLDYRNGWLHWYSDGEGPGATSQIWLKLLPREGQSPLVFVHLPKPFADGSIPAKDQTFVLQLAGPGRWEDVTTRVMPADLDLTLHFRPRRTENRIEAAAYQAVDRQDGRGKAFHFGPRRLDLIWDGRKFDVQQPDGSKLSTSDGFPAATGR